MRLHHLALALISLIPFLVGGCSGGGEDVSRTTPTGAGTATTSSAVTSTAAGTASAAAPATSTSTPAALATPTPTGERPGGDGFRQFATELNARLGQGDIGFLNARIRSTPYTCKAEDIPRQIGGPDCERAGQQFDGIQSSSWRAGGGLVPVERTVAQLNDLKATILAGSQDPFGLAALAVFATDTSGSAFQAVVTTISKRPEGPRRVALVLRFEHDGTRWGMVGILSAYTFADDFLKPTVQGWWRLPGWTRLGRTRTTEEEMLQAVAEAARVLAPLRVRAFPECTPQEPCVAPKEASPSLAQGVIELSFRVSATASGGTLVVMGRDADRVWRFWHSTQQTTHRLLVFPGDLIMCAGGSDVTVRLAPSDSAALAGTLRSGATIAALEFLLTEPGLLDAQAVAAPGQGWYRVKGGEVAGWVRSKFVSDAALKDCRVRDQLEK